MDNNDDHCCYNLNLVVRMRPLPVTVSDNNCIQILLIAVQFNKIFIFTSIASLHAQHTE